ERSEGLTVAPAGQLDQRDQAGGLGLVLLGRDGLVGVAVRVRPPGRRLVADGLRAQPAGTYARGGGGGGTGRGRQQGSRVQRVPECESQLLEATTELVVAREHRTPSPAARGARPGSLPH